MREPASLLELKTMHRMAAALVVADPVYLPIFERIEKEMAAYEANGNAISRARAVAALHKAAA